MEILGYLWKAALAALAILGAVLLGKRTLSSTSAELELVQAKKERTQAALEKARYDEERAADAAKSERYAKRRKVLSDRIVALETTETDLRAVLRRDHDVDDEEYARRFNTRRKAG